MDSNVISSLPTLCVEIIHGIILNWLKNIAQRIIKCSVWFDSDNIHYTVNQGADLNLFQSSKCVHLIRDGPTTVIFGKFTSGRIKKE